MSEHIIIDGISPDGQNVSVDVEIEDGSITIDGHCRFIYGYDNCDVDAVGSHNSQDQN